MVIIPEATDIYKLPTLKQETELNRIYPHYLLMKMYDEMGEMEKAKTDFHVSKTP